MKASIALFLACLGSAYESPVHAEEECKFSRVYRVSETSATLKPPTSEAVHVVVSQDTAQTLFEWKFAGRHPNQCACSSSCDQGFVVIRQCRRCRLSDGGPESEWANKVTDQLRSISNSQGTLVLMGTKGTVSLANIA
eukprot:Gregarina_sp_Pseudo_9__3080@NODE_3277_length_694_cov_13_653435_g2992_i0_p1_GENE_NODE_3277_length_694_cov_13_653435_g2992_i0NODE_3277_length_694_cov_13_653435_g2992_i0_p1_ORF_typecomplete_len138_score8_46_NODE_3277_length_694_cov_13_653435_g2992_i0257670